MDIRNPKTGRVLKPKAKPAALRPRGDKVIGKTQSGKAVYEHAKNPHHQDFSEQDHIDARKHHVRAIAPLTTAIKKMFGKDYDHAAKMALMERREHHRKMAHMHLDMAGDAMLMAGQTLEGGGTLCAADLAKG